MALLLTVLSVLAVWGLLTVLIVALLLIRKTLEGVRRSLEQITMGVRAIEVQTAPLGSRAIKVVGTLSETVRDFAPLPDGLVDVERQVAAAVPLLRRISGGAHA
jgi:uncharacterized protein YoxC